MSENVNNSKGKENNVDQLFSSRSMTQIICFVIVATAAVFGTAPAFCFSCFMIDFCSLMVYDIYIGKTYSFTIRRFFYAE